jgi:hypothetical protein
MSADTEAAALSEQLEDLPRRRQKVTRMRRPSFRYFGIRFSQWGREYKSYCYLCGYESSYGTRGKAVKSAIKHVTDGHGVDGGEAA